MLARNIALRNTLSVRELNDAVQRIIDRIIFLRIAEDRGIEDYGVLRSVCNGNNTYARLQEFFEKADDRYNSGLFHFKPEKGETEPPDRLTPNLVIDDKPLKDILKRLYYPDSPYEFSVLPADILGQVYEQFLGKVIRLTSDHRAVVENKPEVKKAGGVFYTPTYIVDYIVSNTVGKLLEGKTPKTAEKLKILDPACGSGSFLLGAYQYLLDWHLKWYCENDPGKYARAKKPILFRGHGGAWHLTTSERKRILLNNIFGVDIDIQACEVTKLSLLLKVLEGETGETLNYQFKLFHERALPNLGGNIKCGNSLIGPDFYDGKQTSLLDIEEMQRVNSFDWQAEFPGIFKAGGFDAVIGNPPYIRIQALKEWAPKEVEFYKGTYQSAQKGNYDIYVVFVEKGLQLLNKTGRLGFILPHKFFNAQYGEPLRKVISGGKHLADIVHFGDKQIFSNVTTYTCLLFLEKHAREDFGFEKVEDLQAWQDDIKIQKSARTIGKISASNITVSEWNFASGPKGTLLEKLCEVSTKLESATNRIFQGIKTSADRIYIVNEITRTDKKIKTFSPEKQTEYWLETDLLHPLVKGSESRRYALSRTDRLILFPYKNATLIPPSELKQDYPLTWAYLLENKQYLENRENGKMRNDRWYAYGRSQALEVMPLPKIFTPDIAPEARFSFDGHGEVFFTGGAAGGYGIFPADGFSFHYLLGLLNSKLLEWYIKQTATQMRGGWYSFEARFIRNIPIIPPNQSLNKITNLVDQMLVLNRQLAKAKTGHEQTLLQRQIDATDKQIDKLVYELYGLTKDEIALVEGT